MLLLENAGNYLIERRVNLVAAVCSTRWQRTHPKPDLVARIAGHLGRPVEVTANVNAEPFVRSLRAYRPDVVVMASFDQILSADTLAVPTRAWLNIHPSLLPRHRGPEPIYWTIVNGDAEAGITIHQTVPRIDAGPILAQRRVPVSKHDNAGTLSKLAIVQQQGIADRIAERDASSGGSERREPGSEFAPRHVELAPAVAIGIVPCRRDRGGFVSTGNNQQEQRQEPQPSTSPHTSAAVRSAAPRPSATIRFAAFPAALRAAGS